MKSYVVPCPSLHMRERDVMCTSQFPSLHFSGRLPSFLPLSYSRTSDGQFHVSTRRRRRRSTGSPNRFLLPRVVAGLTRETYLSPGRVDHIACSSPPHFQSCLAQFLSLLEKLRQGGKKKDRHGFALLSNSLCFLNLCFQLSPTLTYSLICRGRQASKQSKATIFTSYICALTHLHPRSLA